MINTLNDYFDKIYVITMKDSFRIPRMRERLKGVDYEFFIGCDGATLDKTPYIKMGSKQTRGQLGCTLSHYQLYEKIVSEGYDKVLILEDDCIVNGPVEKLGDYMSQLPEDWGLFYLGWDGVSLPPNYSTNLCEISRAFPKTLHCTHSIAIRPWFAKRLIELNKSAHYTADGLLTEAVKQYDLKTYAAIPKITNPDGMESITVNIDKEHGY
jgi:glycosyl transferase, family 25